MRELPDHAKESILHLSLIGDTYKKLFKGAYVTLDPPSYHAGTEFEWDVLKDLKLAAPNNQIYAKVIDDTSWSATEKFNPFYSQMKLELMYHDDQKQLRMYDHSCSPLELKLVSAEDIGYFNILDSDLLLSDNPIIIEKDA